MKIVTIANQKGGVGKTTSVMNLGVALTRLRKRILVIDSDPQANLTSYLGATPKHTLDELYLAKRGSAPSPREFVTPTQSGLDLIAADRNLAGVEYYLFSRANRESVLKEFLAELVAEYDFILIDTPPSLSLLTVNALVASHSVLIPVQTEFFSLEGIVKIRELIEDVQKQWNPGLSLVGILPTQVNARRKLTEEITNLLQDEFGKTVFHARIRENAAVTESSGHGASVLDYAPSSYGAADYQAAARELANRARSASEKGNSSL